MKIKSYMEIVEEVNIEQCKLLNKASGSDISHYQSLANELAVKKQYIQIDDLLKWMEHEKNTVTNCRELAQINTIKMLIDKLKKLEE